jgi:cold shock protein
MNESKIVYPPQVQVCEGKVKWFHKEKGWGFITYNDKDFFVHHNQIIGRGFQYLREGQRVRFIPEVGEKGGVAKNVERIA